jgi:uncharacterized membrane protein
VTSPDPYAAPKATVADSVHHKGPEDYVPGGQQLPASAGWDWFAEGWRLVMLQPGMWIALIVVFGLLFIVSSLVPFAGSIATMLFSPVIGAGIMIGCRTVDEGGELEMAHLFAGFKEKTGPLVAVGALYLAGCVALLLVIFLVALMAGVGVGALVSGGVDKNLNAGIALGIVLMVLVVVALSIPLMMAIWFAAPLVVFHDLAPTEAMKASFTGCLKNMLPFLIYGLVGLVLAIPATLLLMLGWLALGPVIAASIYASYRDIYTRRR